MRGVVQFEVLKRDVRKMVQHEGVDEGKAMFFRVRKGSVREDGRR